MAKGQKNAISPTREENYPEWYQQVVKASDMAENSPVRGCMVIKPWGYAIWENMQRALDDMFKATGHVNAYFPLLIPLSYLEKEAEHVEGFAKECAVVTHHRLEANDEGGLSPAGELEEPFVIRPTSETIIGASYAKWVNSYRDLPILVNQWANVMRWEMRTRMFLRTSEFLWQEGHTVHATPEEGQEETLKMLDVYETFAEEWMAMPVIKGEKTPDERFPGADATYTIEAMMQDGKALQSGTSHNLGQNFAKASEIKFLDARGDEVYAWTTSWGVSTRLIGGLIMTHSDDDGLVLPPKLAPVHVVLMPMLKKEDTRSEVEKYTDQIAEELRSKIYNGSPLRVKVDKRDKRGGEKQWEYVKKGVPVRVEIGPRDMKNDSVFVGRRDQPVNAKTGVERTEFLESIVQVLDEMQTKLLERARTREKQQTQEVKSLEEFEEFFKTQEGFVEAFWTEDAIGHPLLSKLKVTPRCLPLKYSSERGKCIFTGKEEGRKVVFGKSY